MDMSVSLSSACRAGSMLSGGLGMRGLVSIVLEEAADKPDRV
jgi:hypothetical protein